MRLTVTIDQSEGMSGADIPEQAVKKTRTGSAALSLPSPPRFSHFFFWTTFHYHLGAWNRLLGAMRIKPVNVVWLLYVEKVSLCRTKEEGVWHLISVPSIITLVLGYLSLKDLGIALSIASLSGQMLWWPNFKYRKLIQDKQILLILDTCTLNLWAKSSSNNPSLILIRIIKKLVQST